MRQRTRRRVGALTIASIASLGACSADDGDRSAPDPAASRSTVPEAAVETVPDCEPRVVLDEYGFAIEITDCPSSSADAPSSVDELIEGIPRGDGQKAIDAVAAAAERLATDCGDPSRWSEQADIFVVGAREALGVMVADPAIADWLGGDDATLLADMIQADLMFPSPCDAGSTATTSTTSTSDGVLEAAGRLAGVNDDLRFALLDVEQIVFASSFWFNTDQLGHIIDATAFNADEPVDVLLMGASTIKRGIDPVQLGAAIDRRVYNAAVGALSPDRQLSWYDELHDIGLRPSTVVLGLNTWIEFLECEGRVATVVADSDAARVRAFLDISDLATVPAGWRLVGGTNPTYEGRALENHRASWVRDSGGLVLLPGDLDPAVLASERARFAALPYDALCEDRFERIGAMVDRFRLDGADVVILVLPTSDEMAAYHPDGRAGHDAIVERYRRVADEHGATLLDASDLVDEARYVDLTHVGEEGRAEITDALAAVLAGS